MSNSNGRKVVVIGGGPGGYAAAFMAADLGLDTTIVDLEANPGGVCLYRGCIPSKALLHVAKVLTDAEEAEHWGIKFQKPKIDLDKMRASKDAVVSKMTGGLGQLCKARKITFIQGRASFEDSTTIKVTDERGKEQFLKTDYTILAAGSRPATLPDLLIESDAVLNSTSALQIEDIPKTMLVIGGGYIGLEVGSVYAALGTKVTVVEMTPTLLPGGDPDLVEILAKRMATVMHSILVNTKVAGVKESVGGITVTFETGEGKQRSETFEKVLVSIGRKPNSSGLALNNTQVTVNSRGFVEVDLQRRTTDPHIFAIGDIAGDPMLAHKASHEGRVAAEVIAGHNVAFEPAAIPAVVFTDPEVAWCGMTESQAKRENRAVHVARFPWGASGRASTLNRTDGLTKIITDPDTHQVIGMGIVGQGAGELISQGVLAIEMGATAEDIGLSIHPHPTLSETIMETADLIFGSGTHVYRPPKKD
ncbi:MAG: dihydrolipoyl dehydrogenase [Candidatus Hydrogenedentes bacterium]|nr:dihydrolipoyl dehydrogenase [Candidatus Hydrogenedentota bacterium]